MKPRLRQRGLEALSTLGFSPLDASVYAFLLQESPASGYRIAQALGKPVGNIYKSVESLEDRGAVITSDDDGTRVARAIPINEVTARLRRRMDAAAEIAATLLSEPEPAIDDSGLYRLSDPGVVIERARAMLAGTKKFAVALITPALAETLHADFELAAGKIALGMKVFEPITIAGAVVVPDPRGLAGLETGPGEWLALNCDGAVYLQALFSAGAEDLHTAHWSTNPLLAWTTYTGIAHAIRSAWISNRLAEGISAEKIRARLLTDLPHESSQSFGKLALSARYRDAARPRRRAGSPG